MGIYIVNNECLIRCCIQNTLARARTRTKQPSGQARATLKYIVYKIQCRIIADEFNNFLRQI